MTAVGAQTRPLVHQRPRHDTPAPAAAPAPPRLVERIRAEYAEMPGLRLTLPQAARLWDLEPGVCHAVLDALCGEGYLVRRPSGYVRTGSPGTTTE